MEVRYPPLKRGISAILARYPVKTRQMGAIPPSAILSRKGIARYGGVSRTGPLRSSGHRVHSDGQLLFADAECPSCALKLCVCPRPSRGRRRERWQPYRCAFASMEGLTLRHWSRIPHVGLPIDEERLAAQKAGGKKNADKIAAERCGLVPCVFSLDFLHKLA